MKRVKRVYVPRSEEQKSDDAETSLTQRGVARENSDEEEEEEAGAVLSPPSHTTQFASFACLKKEGGRGSNEGEG